MMSDFIHETDQCLSQLKKNSQNDLERSRAALNRFESQSLDSCLSASPYLFTVSLDPSSESPQVEHVQNMESTEAPQMTSRAHFFHQHGFLHVPSFAHVLQEVIPMKDQMRQLVDKGWQINIEDKNPIAVFRTDEKQIDAIQQGEDYFLSSADAVHFFAEKDALDDKGHLKSEFHHDKVRERTPL
jgi:hypothetical protein